MGSWQETAESLEALKELEDDVALFEEFPGDTCALVCLPLLALACYVNSLGCVHWLPPTVYRAGCTGRQRLLREMHLYCPFSLGASSMALSRCSVAGIDTSRQRLGDFTGGNMTLVKLDGVGGTVLLVKAELHREGLIFPTVLYQHSLETEGFGKMARARGYQPMGLPDYTVYHANVCVHLVVFHVAATNFLL